MHRAIATVSLSGTLRQKLEAIAAARFDGIELFENDFINFNGTAAELRTLTSDLGLGIDLYQPFRDFEGMPEAAFHRNLERAERKFDVMQALGVPTMLVCSNTSPLALPEPGRAAEQLHALAERAARRNLRIGFEALAWGRYVNLYRQAWAIVQEADHPHLGLILDSFHTLSLNDDPSGIAQIPGDRIFFLQMADAPRLAMDVLQWARHYRNFPGQGHLDVEGFFEQVLLSGYSGPLSLEIFNDIFREAPNRRTATDAMRSLLYLESQVRERLEGAAATGHGAATGAAQAAGSAPAEPAPADAERVAHRHQVAERIELFDPPAPPALKGFAFIEFAVDEAGAVPLGRLFQQFGFRHAGRHLSKHVTLYQQGSINLIINAQPESFARQRFAQYGPSVCAIGLLSTDPGRAVNRATALHSARFNSAVGRNELQIPAIIAPGGNAIHFVPAATGDRPFYDIDFVPDDEPPGPADLGMEAIDHVALGLASDELDTWILFCRAVLGLQTADSFELADTFGLTRSAGVADCERNLRFVLNVSSSQRTRTAQAVATSGGGSVHHIAFRCKDLFATVRQLRANGVAFVPISPNYYDDLATRFDLDDSLLHGIRELGLLFDRSPAGDYLHIYTEAFAGRFFFEFVQRVADYDAYGAMNAAARIASQAQVERET